MLKCKYYLKPAGRRGKIKIWLVDGNLIRQELNEEFTNFGQHYKFNSIPKYEFWLDKEAVPNEKRFFIDHLLIEWQLMKKGLGYKRAYRAAAQKEKKERIKAGDLAKVNNRQGVPDKNKIYCRRLGKTADKISVWLVYGRLVRSAFDVNFTEGGHGLVYKYIPKNEVWLDNDITGKERPYILLHELYERSLMDKGTSYLKAHPPASRLEWRVRHNRALLKKNLAELGWNLK